MKLRLGFFLTTCMVPAASVFAQEPAKTATATPNVPGQVAPAPGLLPATTPPKLLPIRKSAATARQVGYETGTAQSNMTTTTVTGSPAQTYAPAAVPTYPPQPAAAPVYTNQPAYQAPQTYQAPQGYQAPQAYSNAPAQTYTNTNTQTYTAPQPYNSSPIYQAPAPAATPKTEVQRQLELLYQKDGRQAPPMTLQEMPQQQGSAPAQMQTAPSNQQPQQMQPQQQMGQQQFGQQQAEQPKPGFLQRIFSFHKRPQQQPQAQSQAAQMPPRTNAYANRPGQPMYGTPRPVTQPARPYQAYQPPPPPAFRYPVAQQPGQAQMPPQNLVAQAPNGYQPPAPLPTTQPGIAPPQPLPPPLTNVPNVAPTAEARQIEESPTLEDSDSENMDILDKAPAAEESPFSGLKLQTPESDGPGAAEAEEDVELPSDPPKVKAPRATDDSAAKMRQLAAIHDKAGFKGFCPVALKNNRELVPCRGEFQAEYRGRLYEFSSAQAKAEFEKAPHDFAPVNSGFDTVALVEHEERKDGSLDHAAWYRGRLYMFMNQSNLDIFLSAPEEYAAEEVRTPKVPSQDAPQLKSEAELEADEAPVLNAEPDDSDPFLDDEMEADTAAEARAEAPKAEVKTKPTTASAGSKTTVTAPRSSKGK